MYTGLIDDHDVSTKGDFVITNGDDEAKVADVDISTYIMDKIQINKESASATESCPTSPTAEDTVIKCFTFKSALAVTTDNYNLVKITYNGQN